MHLSMAEKAACRGCNAPRLYPPFLIMKYYYRLLKDRENASISTTSEKRYNSPKTALCAAITNLMYYAYNTEFRYNRLEVWKYQGTGRLVYSMSISELKNFEHING